MRIRSARSTARERSDCSPFSSCIKVGGGVKPNPTLTTSGTKYGVQITLSDRTPRTKSMRFTFVLRAAAIALVAVCAGSSPAAERWIVENGKPHAEIVIAEKPQRTVRIAAA